MNSATRLSLIGFGAGLMFLLDPARGPRRRALIRDKFVRFGRERRDGAAATGRDIGNRWTGFAAEARADYSKRPGWRSTWPRHGWSPAAMILGGASALLAMAVASRRAA